MINDAQHHRVMHMPIRREPSVERDWQANAICDAEFRQETALSALVSEEVRGLLVSRTFWVGGAVCVCIWTAVWAVLVSIF